MRLIQAKSMWRSFKPAEPSPRGVTRGAKRRAGEAIELSSCEMTQRVAGKSVEGEQDDVHQQDE